MATVNANRLLLFTRFPEPGTTKTRLIPQLGADGAARLHEQMTHHTLREAAAVDAALQVRFAGGSAQEMADRFGRQYSYISQGDGDLGNRMASAITSHFSDGADRVLVIGSDCPGIRSDLLNEAFVALRTHDLVIGPAVDGGYYLLGLCVRQMDVLAGIDWGTSKVFEQTMQRAIALGLRVATLATLRDVDRPEDLRVWTEQRRPARLSVIVPTLNEEERIEATLQQIARATDVEIIVVDGGSTDRTLGIASRYTSKVYCCAPGRAEQQNTGASHATAPALLFCHADTVLPDDYDAIALDQLTSDNVALGAFSLKIRSGDSKLRPVERAVALRSRYLKLPYGDQAYFLRRSTFDELKGFSNLRTMEDFDLVRRAAKLGCVITVRESVQTSGRLWRMRGVVWTTLVHQLIVLGYFLGVSDRTLASIRKWLCR